MTLEQPKSRINRRPGIIDLFCGAGGAAVGYHRAGFDVVGVDIEDQPRYPFPMIKGDAMTLDHYEGFVAVHASPPCQAYSTALKHLSNWQPMLIDMVREMMLRKPGIYWIIENVPGSPLPKQSTLLGSHGVELCGTMFGLKIQRHRLFETNFPVGPPCSCNHTEPVMNFYKTRTRPKEEGKTAGQIWAREMGVEWMKGREVRNAIPPVYTEWLGRQLYETAYPAAS